MLLACSVTGMDAGTIKYTYANDDYGNWGFNKKEAYDVAVRIDDPSLVGKKIISARSFLYATSDIDNISIWLSKELKLENKKNAPDIVSVSTEVNAKTGEIKVTFAEPYTITEEGVYVGYSFNVTALTEETMNPLSLTTAVNENGFFLHTSRSVLKWINYSERLPASAPVEVTIEGDFPEASLGFKSVAPLYYGQAGKSTDISVKILNQGTESVTSIDYSCVIDGATKTSHLDLETPIKPDFINPADLVIPVDLPSAVNIYDLTISIDKVNGVENEAVVKSAVTAVDVVSYVPKHRPVMEEYTGTWCGWCTRGWFALEKMNGLYPDDFIGIAYHNNDPMAVLDEYTYPVSIAGFPSSTIDRGYELDPYYGSASDGFGIEQDWLDARNTFSPAGVEAYAWWTDESKTSIGVLSETTFIKKFSGSAYKMAYVLCANDLHSTDEDWNQGNYFPSYARDYEGTELYALCEMGSSINDLHFNEVAIIADDVTGEKNPLPEEIEAGKVIKGDYAFDLADAVSLNGVDLVQDKEKLFVVAMLIDGETGRIINADKTAIAADKASGITEVKKSEASVKAVAYYDLQGRRTNASARGLYIKKTTFSDGTVTSEKVVEK